MSANNGKGKWVHHFRASDDEHVRDVVLQRRDNGIKVEFDEGQDGVEKVLFHALKIKSLFSRYHIIFFCGSYCMNSIRISSSGKLIKKSLKYFKAPGPFIKIQNDEQHRTGCLLLVYKTEDKTEDKIQVYSPDNNELQDPITKEQKGSIIKSGDYG